MSYFRHFFLMTIGITLITVFNSLVVLPVVLSFIGPCCEVRHENKSVETNMDFLSDAYFVQWLFIGEFVSNLLIITNYAT